MFSCSVIHIACSVALMRCQLTLQFTFPLSYFNILYTFGFQGAKTDVQSTYAVAVSG